MVVGERGPELVTLPRGSKVATANETREMQRNTGTSQSVYIAKMMPHNYGEFERQMRTQSRLASIGGRRPAVA